MKKLLSGLLLLVLSGCAINQPDISTFQNRMKAAQTQGADEFGPGQLVYFRSYSVADTDTAGPYIEEFGYLETNATPVTVQNSDINYADNTLIPRIDNAFVVHIFECKLALNRCRFGGTQYAYTLSPPPAFPADMTFGDYQAIGELARTQLNISTQDYHVIALEAWSSTSPEVQNIPGMTYSTASPIWELRFFNLDTPLSRHVFVDDHTQTVVEVPVES